MNTVCGIAIGLGAMLISGFYICCWVKGGDMLFLAFLSVTAAVMIVAAKVVSGWFMVVLLICIGLGSLIIYANLCMMKDIYRGIKNGRKED